MIEFTVKDRSGTERLVNATGGQSLMEILRDEGFDDLLALCGGCCSCATCHVYIEGAGPGDLPPMTDDENDLLDSSSCREPQSRLSCQIPFDENLAGSRITIAPED